MLLGILSKKLKNELTEKPVAPREAGIDNQCLIKSLRRLLVGLIMWPHIIFG